MRKIITFIILSIVLSGGRAALASHAEHAQEHSAETSEAPDSSEHAIAVQPSQAVVEVHGVVCSFCAFGVEKKLRRLPFLDTEQFSNGVMTDIEAHQVTLALLPEREVDLGAIVNAITDAGYEPIAIHLRLSGEVDQQGNRTLLHPAGSNAVFELVGPQRTNAQGTVEMQGHVVVKELAELQADQPAQLHVDRLGVDG